MYGYAGDLMRCTTPIPNAPQLGAALLGMLLERGIKERNHAKSEVSP